MKMLMIAYDDSMDSQVMDVIHLHAQAEYTKWNHVIGWGQHSEPHLMSPIWPKANNVLMTCLEDEKASHILESLRGLKKNAGLRGLKAFLLPVLETT